MPRETQEDYDRYDRYVTNAENRLKESQEAVDKANAELEKIHERQTELNEKISSSKEEFDRTVDSILENHPYSDGVRKYRELEEESSEARDNLRKIEFKINVTDNSIDTYSHILKRAQEDGNEAAVKQYQVVLDKYKALKHEQMAKRDVLAMNVKEYEEMMDEAKGEAKDKEWKQIYNLSVERDTVQDGPYTEFSQQAKDLKAAGVKYVNPVKYASTPSEEKIIKKLAGGDETRGSCASLAMAYLFNKAGYNILDFRGGKSQDIFSYSRSFIKKLNGLTEESKNDIEASQKLFDQMEEGKEYYFAAGRHAAVIRKKDGKVEYLELQSSSSNGWKEMSEKVLRNRFRAVTGRKNTESTCMIEASLMTGNQEYLSLMGYINTSEDKQKKGASGFEK